MFNEEVKMDKKILDVTAGSRMMWFDKNDTRALFSDIRKEECQLCDGRTLTVNPDIISDFTSLPFDDSTFNLVVFDPPHLRKAGSESWLSKKYGILKPSWKVDLRDGINECMRVLKSGGVLIFKWNEDQIKVREILELIEHKPLFGHPTKRGGTTIWMTFMKD